MENESLYRKNAGIILLNHDNEVLWARRLHPQNAWQFPQGGINPDEDPINAMYRELKEEIGLLKSDVEYIAETKDWLTYELPEKYIRYDTNEMIVGQKQKWFLLRLISDDSHIKLDYALKPEFDAWKWVDFWYPLEHVIEFKKAVYQKALEELSVYLDHSV